MIRSIHLPVLIALVFLFGYLSVPVLAAQDAHDTHAGHSDHGEKTEQTMAHDDHTGHGHDHGKMVEAAKKETPDLAQMVKVEEQLGKTIDMDAVFVDSKGNEVRIGDLFDKPVVFLPVFFMCTSVCNILQADLANALNQVGPVPGRDFNIITFSFSDDEDASHARTSKQNYLNIVTREIEPDNWYHLTGDAENIRRVTDSLGYYFVKKKEHFYVHPSALIVLAKDGKITRYLYGPGFLPFDIGMALSEAEKGETGISIKRGVLSFCFDYDPQNKTYVFKTFRITGTVILVLLVGFIIFLIYPSKRDKPDKDTTVS